MTKPSDDPYAALGVARDATPEQVRKAHRRAAKRTHPDAGGDPEEFRRVNGAYMVLSDPARRKRYDETGDASPPRPDDLVREVVTLFLQCAANCADHMDPLDAARASVASQMRQLKEQARAARAEAARLDKLAGRVKAKAGPNVLAEALRNLAADHRRQAAASEAALEKGERMLALLAGYEVEPVEHRMPGGLTVRQMAGGSAGWFSFTST